MAPMEEHEQNVFGWLDNIRLRPFMYLGSLSLRDLETLIHGYYHGLGVHGIVEPVPSMQGHFMMWLKRRTGWDCCKGWAYAIDQHYAEPKAALAAFFEF